MKLVKIFSVIGLTIVAVLYLILLVRWHQTVYEHAVLVLKYYKYNRFMNVIRLLLMMGVFFMFALILDAVPIYIIYKRYKAKVH